MDEKLLEAIAALEAAVKDRKPTKWELEALRGLYKWRNNDLMQRGSK